ncbi:MAG TPA: decarboxylating 6-phosphogluconate dehydrogenase [Caulobacteraceae bacterium]|nr:decarboxylating 6-phosphogluconate dehydrogenase [Caulobacteraceae bacterium]
MQLGVIGMGRMGANIARRLMRGGHSCVVWDRDAKAVADVAKDGASAADNPADLVKKLEAPRAVWVMLPAGAPTEDTIAALGGLLAKGDIVIDGGNSFYRDDIRRARAVAEKGITYVDVGTSGGVWGLERGYCMMIGGEKAAVDRLDPIFKTLAPGLGEVPRTKRANGADPRAELGYIHAGPAGAGHFVKMVHNGIEYGLMQAYAEGFDVLVGKGSDNIPADDRFDLNVADVAEVWRRGSVISSWLLDLSAQALAGDPKLAKYEGSVADSGEGRWTIEAAIEEAVPADVLAAALFARFRSRQEHTFGERLLSAMRYGFGGHIETPT